MVEKNNEKISKEVVDNESVKGNGSKLGLNKKTARIAGSMYLGVIILGILSQVIIRNLIVPDDAAATAGNITANEMQFAAGSVIWLISEMFFLMLGVALYLLLKQVDKNLATLMLVLVAVGVAIESINTLNNFAALHLLGSSEYQAAFSAEQVNAQVMHHIESWEAGYRIAAMMSFGPWLIPAGYLVYKSSYFPRILGIVVMLGGIGLLIEAFQFFLLPDHEVISLPGSVVAVIGEFALCGWLLVKGVKVPGYGSN